jgi:menaquinone-dependent protoporphyrinogen oxidase
VVGQVDAGLFAGKMDYSRLGFFARMAVQYFVKVPQGDFRNWDAIRAWARAVYPRLIADSGQS